MNTDTYGTTSFKPTSAKRWLALLSLLALTAAWAMLIGADSRAETQPRPTPIAVRAIALTEQQPEFFRSFSGTTRATQRATIRPQVIGRVMERHVELGDQVNAGQLLVSLFNPEATPAALAASKQWQQARVTREQLERDYRRINDLFKVNVASKQENETARTALLAAQAAESSAESDYLRANQVNQEQQIRAPFAGMITDTLIEPGEVVVPGQALVQLADPSQVEVEVTVSEATAAVVQSGDSVSVSLPLLGSAAPLQGVIQQVTPFRERGALPTVVVALPSASVRPGLSASVHFPYTEDSHALTPTFALPTSALVKRGDSGAVVYRVTEQQIVEAVQVEPRQLANGLVTVRGDLKPNDRIVSAGVRQLFAGASVEIVR
ncbi:MAG: efflux RND transporter periplasmic adaptor subunit [Candidatus Pelagadaptatus aseana]|uniref:efflux RND transporter periplasmic adaptor subunit n=1 Tax=Candidatus Pelagadaptatus aseana TaxID=3120508 RepID=UPI0039B2122B